MSRKVHVTPGSLTALQARAGLVVAVLFLLFGVVFMAAVIHETSASEVGLLTVQAAFLLIWLAVCVSLIVFFARLLSGRKAPQQNSLFDVHLEDAGGDGFATRLRSLEMLKEDGLVSEAEYREKRAQILGERW